LPDIIAIAAFKIPLSKKAGHALKRASNIANVTIEEFVCAKEGSCCEITIPQVS